MSEASDNPPYFILDTQWLALIEYVASVDMHRKKYICQPDNPSVQKIEVDNDTIIVLNNIARTITDHQDTFTTDTYNKYLEYWKDTTINLKTDPVLRIFAKLFYDLIKTQQTTHEKDKVEVREMRRKPPLVGYPLLHILNNLKLHRLNSPACKKEYYDPPEGDELVQWIFAPANYPTLDRNYEHRQINSNLFYLCKLLRRVHQLIMNWEEEVIQIHENRKTAARLEQAEQRHPTNMSEEKEPVDGNDNKNNTDDDDYDEVQMAVLTKRKKN